jgi:acetylornithine deacetylase/succinyl-diaminopimelate desuccinylase-like protein
MRSQKVYEHIDANFDTYLEDIRAYLRQTGVSITGEGIPETAEYTADLIRKIGGTAQLVRTKGNPVVFGRMNSRRPGAKTLIASSLYDVVPADPAEWITDPFGAEIVDSNDHPEVGWDVCRGATLVGRGSRNQRGPNLAFMLTLQAIREVTGDIPVNVIFTFDGEEEIASPSWQDFLSEKESELKEADAAYQHGFRQDENGRHMIQLGFKGVTLFELVVTGGEWGGTLDARDLGPGDMVWVDSPVLVLLEAVSSLFDRNGRCVIDGFWDNVAPTTPKEQELYDVLRDRFDEQAAKKARNVARFRPHKPAADLYVEWCSSPILNIDGLVAGYTTEQYTTVSPMRAVAKMDVRLVPNQSLDEFYEKLRAHLDTRGLHMVQIRRHGGVQPGKSDPNDPLVAAAIAATQRFGIEPQVWPISSAGNPLAFYARPPFNLPIMFAGTGWSWKSHMPNEWCSVEGIRDSMKWTATFLEEWASIP